MGILYLDVDDEITSAVQRLREAGPGEVALVLQAGSRIATSRINFRLLSREADERRIELSIVAPEASARALATAADLPAYQTVLEYEDAVRSGRGAAGAADDPVRARGGAGIRDRAGTPRAGRAQPALAGEGTGEVTRTMSGGRGLDPRTGMADGFISVAPRRERHWRRYVILAIALTALLVGGVTGYAVLPGAWVTLAVRTVPVGPVRFEVRADASVIDADAVTGMIPATTVEFSLTASASFKATGKRVEEQTASGTVRWSNCDYLRTYTVPKDSVVKTASGVQFVTSEALLLPNATTETSSDGRIVINCSSRPGDIVAKKPGKAGNVPAGTITIIPPTLDARAISVTNRNPTSGGTHDEFPRIEQADIDAALVTLGKQIDENLAKEAQDPAGVPDGAVVYPETAVRDDPVPTVDPTGLVGLEQASFDLGVLASGAVLAVDSTPIDAIGRTRVAAKVPAGHDLLANSEKVSWGAGVANGQEITFQATASAAAVPRIDEAKIRQLVRGKTPDAAQAALAGIGDVTITVWPDWVRTITTLDLRLDVRVEGLPQGRPSGGSPAPSGVPGASASPGS